MIIGVTGSYGAGKDTIADYLVKKGFVYHSLSDILREELRVSGESITRENLINIGNKIRTKFGPGELAQRALAVIQKKGETNSIIVSIRNPEEVKILKEQPGFQMWFVDAPQRVRYERTITRQRTDDFYSFEDFMEKEKRENSSDPNAQQLNEVAKLAQITINNDSDFASLYQKIDELLAHEKR